MNLSTKAMEINEKITQGNLKLGDLRNIATTIKKDHYLAMELWSTENFMSRQLAILIMDKTLLSEEVIDQLDKDIQQHNYSERIQLIDWLMANQLMKNKKTITLIESWIDSKSVLKRRVFWYYQGRLRWVGQTPPSNSEKLLSIIEKNILTEKPEIQWAMNFTAAQIGIFQKEYRTRCINLGEKTALYKDEKVSKNCTPNYLPIYISMQVNKLKRE